jgi:hypothetical protein
MSFQCSVHNLELKLLKLQKGLTSDILISVAEIAHDRKTTIPRFAPMQLSFRTAIDIVVQESKEVVETSAIDLPDAKGLANGEPPDHARA